MSAKRFPIGSPEWIKNYKARTKKARDKCKKKNPEKQIACVKEWKLKHTDKVVGQSKKDHEKRKSDGKYAERKKSECGVI